MSASLLALDTVGLVDEAVWYRTTSNKKGRQRYLVSIERIDSSQSRPTVVAEVEVESILYPIVETDPSRDYLAVAGRVNRKSTIVMIRLIDFLQAPTIEIDEVVNFWLPSGPHVECVFYDSTIRRFNVFAPNLQSEALDNVFPKRMVLGGHVDVGTVLEDGEETDHVIVSSLSWGEKLECSGIGLGPNPAYYMDLHNGNFALGHQGIIQAISWGSGKSSWRYVPSGKDICDFCRLDHQSLLVMHWDKRNGDHRGWAILNTLTGAANELTSDPSKAVFGDLAGRGYLLPIGEDRPVNIALEVGL